MVRHGDAAFACRRVSVEFYANRCSLSYRYPNHSSADCHANRCSLPYPYPNYSSADCHIHAWPNSNADTIPSLHCRH